MKKIRQGKYIDGEGNECWYRDGKYHREDGPAMIFKDGSKHWYKNNLRHREDGPAIIYPDDTEYYYLEGNRIAKVDYLKVQNCPLEELPLYINTELAPVVRRRLQNATG